MKRHLLPAACLLGILWAACRPTIWATGDLAGVSLAMPRAGVLVSGGREVCVYWREWVWGISR